MAVAGDHCWIHGLAPRALDANTIEYMWSAVKKAVRETRHILRLKNGDALWTLLSHAWHEWGCFVWALCSIPNWMMHRKMRSVLEDQGLRTPQWRWQALETTLANMFHISYEWMMYLPIPVASPSTACFCGCSVDGIAGSNPAGAWTSVFRECCVLSGRGLWEGPIPRPEESYRAWCVLEFDQMQQ
jgi:hypothetical protein